jgi:N,N'-diacetylchitobiose transport system substrate-binding protein
VKRLTKLVAGAAAIALATAGCAGSGGGSSDSSSGGDKTLTVWLMSGSAPETLTDALNKEFEAANKGVTVKYEVQEWGGIQDKLTTALASQDPPDVIELGNTLTPSFSADGVLTDLTGDVADLNGDQWLSSLKQSGEWDGKDYATPFYAANRVVLYRTDMFQQAGITATPTSRQEWLDAITKLKATFGSDPQFQPLYMPGQNWYTLLSFIYDEGGNIAKKDGKEFKATVNSPEAKAGLEFYKQLVDASGTTQGQRRAEPRAGRHLRSGQGRDDGRAAVGGRDGREGQPGHREEHLRLPDPVEDRRQDRTGLPGRLEPRDPGQQQELRPREGLPEAAALRQVPVAAR